MLNLFYFKARGFLEQIQETCLSDVKEGVVYEKLNPKSRVFHRSQTQI